MIIDLLRSVNGRVLIESHRGAEGIALENSWESIESGYKAGADIIEIDVQVSKDGVVFIRHNYSINENIWCKSLSWDELRKSVQSEQELPRLEDVFAWAKDTRAILALDMKGGFGTSKKLYVATMGLINKFEIADQLLILDWNHNSIKEIKKTISNIKTRALLRGRPVNIVQVVNDCNADAISLSYDLITQEEVDQLHKAGKAVALVEMWHPDFKMANDLGIDILSWGNPAEAKQGLGLINEN